jgi:hypothetical protein
VKNTPTVGQASHQYTHQAAPDAEHLLCTTLTAGLHSVRAPQDTVKATAPVNAQRKARVTQKDAFHRVLVQRPGAAKRTTVSLSPTQYNHALKFAYGDRKLLNTSIRAAALTVPPGRPQDFSRDVRKKLLKQLHGAFRPELVPKFGSAEVALAAENNELWSAVERGGTV